LFQQSFLFSETACTVDKRVVTYEMKKAALLNVNFHSSKLENFTLIITLALFSLLACLHVFWRWKRQFSTMLTLSWFEKWDVVWTVKEL